MHGAACEAQQQIADSFVLTNRVLAAKNLLSNYVSILPK